MKRNVEGSKERERRMRENKRKKRYEELCASRLMAISSFVKEKKPPSEEYSSNCTHEVLGIRAARGKARYCNGNNHRQFYSSTCVPLPVNQWQVRASICRRGGPREHVELWVSLPP